MEQVVSIQLRIDAVLQTLRDTLERPEVPVDVVAARLLSLQADAYQWNSEDIDRQDSVLAPPVE